jgi:hypothetical protein
MCYLIAWTMACTRIKYNKINGIQGFVKEVSVLRQKSSKFTCSTVENPVIYIYIYIYIYIIYELKLLWYIWDYGNTVHSYRITCAGCR